MTYQLSPFAEEDLDKIWHDVAEQASEDTAEKVVSDIVVEKYLVYDRIAREAVVISRVFHARPSRRLAGIAGGEAAVMTSLWFVRAVC